MGIISTFVKLAAISAAATAIYRLRQGGSEGQRSTAGDAAGDEYPGNEPSTYS